MLTQGKKYIQAVNKQEKTYLFILGISDIDKNNLIEPFIERGDTIVINNQGDVLKNITMERLNSEYVRGR